MNSRMIWPGMVSGLAFVGAILAAAPSWSASATRVSSFEYNSTSGLLTKETVEPDSTQLKLVTEYTLDAFGNRTAVEVSSPATGSAAIDTRSSTTTYDSNGRFATGSANALTHSETRVFSAGYGQITSLTGPNSLTTTWTYDGFGRKTLETRADGTKTKWEYLYCSGTAGGSATCPTYGKYLVVTTPLQSDGTTQNGPLVKTYHDALNREIRAETQGFASTAIYVDTQYDSNGRVSQKSRPYFTGGTAQWTVFTYDAIGRVTQETQPDSSYTTFAYSVTSGAPVTVATNSASQARTTTRNSQGQVASVKDALNNTTVFTYDPFGNLLTTTDPAGNVTTLTYNIRGHKTAMADPDLGSWSYSYDALGQLVSQTDAKSQTATFSYDKLGRMLSRTEPDLSSTWVWDTATKGVGKLTSAAATDYLRTHSYDSLGRPTATAIEIDSTTYTTTTAYDGQGRVDTLTYPSGFTVQHVYTSLGYLQKVRNATTTTLVYWQADAMNAERQLTQFTQGNSVQTTRSFDAATGRPTAIQAGTSNAVQNLSFTWDPIGNLLDRTDSTQSPEVTEEFEYDALNRLTQSAVVDGDVKTFTYDSIGNITSKTGVGSYSYPTSGSSSVRPHAVSSITGTVNGVTNPTFSYDANGNLTSGAGKTLTWTSYNQAATVARGGTTLTFTHDPEHQRIKQHVSGTNETTIYVNAQVRTERLVDNGGSTIRWNNYIYAEGGIVAVFYDNASTADVTRYFHKDHLGSVAVITNESAGVVERLAYDPWGKRRFIDGSDDTSETIASLTDRGFTGHEHLQEAGLIHMNGRVYDPLLGRFMSADPFIQDPFNTQSLNRYAYVLNNPLAYTDPNGYFFKSIFKAIASAFKAVAQSPVGQAVEMIAAFYACGPAGPACAGAVAAANTGINGGSLGDMVKAYFVTSITAGALQGINGPNGIESFAGRVAASAAVGGLSSVASGGNFQSGFLAAGFTAFVGPIDFGGGPANFAARIVIGGTASAIGGGKFANGAVTGAFAYAVGQISNGAPDVSAAAGGIAGAGGSSQGVDINLFSTDDPLYASANKVQGSPNTFTIAGHGSPMSMAGPDGSTILPGDLAGMIKANPAYHGQDVLLLSCNTGVTLSASTPFAQQLSTALGVNVQGANNFVWFYTSGRYVVAPPVSPANATWQTPLSQFTGGPDTSRTGQFLRFAPGPTN